MNTRCPLPSSIELRRDLVGGRIAQLRDERINVALADRRRCPTSLRVGCECASPLTPDPTFDARLADVKSSRDHGITSLAGFVRLDDPFSQFKRMRFRHDPTRSRLDPTGKTFDRPR